MLQNINEGRTQESEPKRLPAYLIQQDLGLLLGWVLPIDFKGRNFKQASSSLRCVHASQISGSREGRKTTPIEMKGQIESLLAEDTCRIHARLDVGRGLLALPMCFLTHNRLQPDLTGHISLLLWASLHLLFRVIISTHI